MPEPKAPPPDHRRDVAAFALLAFGAIIAACVATHNPSRTVDATWPPAFSDENLFGAPGAMLAESLFDPANLGK